MKILLLAAVLAAFGCGSDSVSSEGDAQNAYLGLDLSIDKAITLGFAGFNSASSANISPQATNGAATGTLTVTGQVDQGASANKGMRLFTAFVNYSDNGEITYNTSATNLPALDMMLLNIPTGTLTGTFVGTVTMTGEEEGELHLNLTFAGQIQAGAGGIVERKPGTTHITGTATSSAGTFNVDVTR
jgi:hypothetical protein